jgi:hypothetical protein
MLGGIGGHVALGVDAQTGLHGLLDAPRSQFLAEIAVAVSPSPNDD